MSRPECHAFFTDGPAGVQLLCRRPSGHVGPHDTDSMQPWLRFLPKPEDRKHTVTLETAELDLIIHALGSLDRGYAARSRRRPSRDLADSRAIVNALRVRLLQLDEVPS